VKARTTIIQALVPNAGTAAGRAWLTSFADLLCLMLTFFVMLYSMAEPNGEVLLKAASSAQGTADTGMSGNRANGAELSASTIERGRAIDLGYLGQVLDLQLQQNPQFSAVVITRSDEALVLVLPGDLLFEPGGVELSPGGVQMTALLAQSFGNFGNAVELAGHTAPTPAGPDFASNWELSLARAQAVAASLAAAGYRRPVTVRGMADSRFDDIPQSLSDAERQRLAQRVDIVIRQHRSGR
jgi:chemotaxis protein MotB